MQAAAHELLVKKELLTSRKLVDERTMHAAERAELEQAVAALGDQLRAKESEWVRAAAEKDAELLEHMEEMSACCAENDSLRAEVAATEMRCAQEAAAAGSREQELNWLLKEMEMERVELLQRIAEAETGSNGLQRELLEIRGIHQELAERNTENEAAKRELEVEVTL